MPYSAFQPLHPAKDLKEYAFDLGFQCPTRHSSRCTILAEGKPLSHCPFQCPTRHSSRCTLLEEWFRCCTGWFQCPTRHSSRCTQHGTDRGIENPYVSMPYSAFQPLHPGRAARRQAREDLRFQCPTRHSSRCTGSGDDDGGGWVTFQCPTRHSSRCTPPPGGRDRRRHGGFNALLGIPAVAPPQKARLLGKGGGFNALLGIPAVAPRQVPC